MGRNKYIVRVNPGRRSELEKLVSTGKANARKITHARILLKVDADGPNGQMKKYRTRWRWAQPRLNAFEKHLLKRTRVSHSMNGLPNNRT